jgi:NAD(P)-dependent dehydrogenase (short-subunit alcohol dehydrogenase family)
MGLDLQGYIPIHLTLTNSQLNPSRVALVTGAGGSIGQAIVQQFARDGVTKIAGIDISASALKSVAAHLSSFFPAVEFLALTCDLADEGQVEAAFQQAISKFYRLDYVVNNAGIGGPFAPTSESDVAALERVMNVNLKGVWLCERAALKQMLTQEPLALQEYSP